MTGADEHDVEGWAGGEGVLWELMIRFWSGACIGGDSTVGMTLRFPLREPGVVPSSVTQWVTKSRAWDLRSSEMANGGRFLMKEVLKL